MKSGVIIALAAAIICIATTPVAKDARILEDANPPELPIHLLSDEEAIAAYRMVGYARSIDVQRPHFRFWEAVTDQREPASYDFVSGLLSHNLELVAKALGNSHSLRRHRILLQDPKKLQWHDGAARLFNEIADRLFEQHDLPPELVQRAIDVLAEAERIGLGAFVGPLYELMANWCFMMHRDEEALLWLEKGLAADIEGENISGMSQYAGRIGIYHMNKENLAKAEEALLQSYRYAEINQDPSYLSRSLAFLAELRERQGHFADAESLLVQSIECARTMRDPNTQLFRFTDLAKLYVSLSEYDRAEAIIEKAIPLGERCLSDALTGGFPLWRNSAAYYLARCIELRAKIRLAGGSPSAAAAAMREALFVAKQNVDWRLETALTKGLADACAAAGHEKEAARCYERAIENARRHGERGLESEYVTALGEFYLDRSDFRRATEHLKRSAALASTPELWMQKIAALHLLARSKALGREYDEAQRLLEESIASFERGLAGKRFAEDRHALRRRIRGIFADLIALQSRQRDADCGALLFTAEKARQLRSGERGIHHKDLDSSIARCIDTRSWIPANTLVVQHIVTPERLIIAAMDCRGASFHSQEIAEKGLEAEVAAFIDACGATSNAAGESAAACRDAEARARSLYARLLAPIDSLIAGAESLCFISDEPLRRVPFGALMPPGTDGRFLVESKNIFASSTLLALHAALHEHRARSTVGFVSPLIIGEPDIGACLARNYPVLERLPHARNEMLEIRNAIGRATLLSGLYATKQAVIAELKMADLIHIATHRVVYPALSGKTALLLSMQNDCDIALAVETSLLADNEIARLDLSRARLVMLSACESAAAENETASESMGLAGAFLDAGAQTVIATIWPIEDEAAERLAITFYRELIAGKSDAGTALQIAQRKMIRESRSKGNPAKDIPAWAPYLAIGCFR